MTDSVTPYCNTFKFWHFSSVLAKKITRYFNGLSINWRRDREKNSIFTLRLGGKRIVRYSLDLLDIQQKISFLFDFYNSVEAGEFNEDITDFLAKEIDNAAVRKKEANERRKNKKKAEREQKAREKQEEYARKVEETRQRTLAAAEPMLHEMYIQSEAARQNAQNQYVSERV